MKRLGRHSVPENKYISNIKTEAAFAASVCCIKKTPSYKKDKVRMRRLPSGNRLRQLLSHGNSSRNPPLFIIPAKRKEREFNINKRLRKIFALHAIVLMRNHLIDFAPFLCDQQHNIKGLSFRH